MKLKSLSSIAFLPLAAAGTVAFSGNANAASINPPASGTINFQGSVVIQFDAGANTFSFDFAPNGGGSGDLASLFATDCSGSFADFCPTPVAPFFAFHKTLDVAASPGSGGDLVIDNFITLVDPANPADADDYFDLMSIGLAEFTESVVNGNTNTALAVSVEGMWQAEDGTFYNGTGVYTTQFVGLTAAEVEALLASGDAITASISANYDIREKNVPEPATLGGLALVAMSALGLRKKGRS